MAKGVIGCHFLGRHQKEMGRWVTESASGWSSSRQTDPSINCGIHEEGRCAPSQRDSYLSSGLREGGRRGGGWGVGKERREGGREEGEKGARRKATGGACGGGSVGTTLVMQAWRPEFKPQNHQRPKERTESGKLSDMDMAFPCPLQHCVPIHNNKKERREEEEEKVRDGGHSEDRSCALQQQPRNALPDVGRAG